MKTLMISALLTPMALSVIPARDWPISSHRGVSGSGQVELKAIQQIKKQQFPFWKQFRAKEEGE